MTKQLWSLLGGVIVAATCQHSLAAITDSLEVYFDLNESSGTTAADASGNSRDGVLLNRGGAWQSVDPNMDGDFSDGTQPLPNDPDPGHSPWVEGRFGGGFAPAGAPDADGDAAPQFQSGPAYPAGQAYWMLGANLANGGSNITSSAFTYAFHIRLPYNAEHSKGTNAGGQGEDTVRPNQVLHDAYEVKSAAFGLASSDTNFWNFGEFNGTPIDHMNGNRRAYVQVGEGGGDNLFHHYRGGAVGVISDTDPPLFDVDTSPLGALVDGKWHHIAIVDDYSIAPTDGSVKDSFLYIDGDLVAWTNENIGSTASDDHIGAITLGAIANTYGNDAARLAFDDYAMWSRALEPSEIRALSQQAARQHSRAGDGMPGCAARRFSGDGATTACLR